MKTIPGEYPLVVTGKERRSSNTYQIDAKAVCVPIVSSSGHGHASIKRIHYQEGKFALGNIMVALIPNEKICVPKYLFYLCSVKKDEFFVSLMHGSANVTLSVEDVSDIEISLPDLDEQNRIMGILEKLDNIKKLERDSFNLTDTLIQNIFVEMFGSPLKNEKGWNEGSLGEFLERSPDNGFFKKTESYGKGVQIVWVDSLFDRYTLEENGLRLIDANEKEIEKFRISVNDILICRSSLALEGVGKMVVVEDLSEDTLFESHVMRMKVNTEKILPYYVVSFFNSLPGRELILEKARVSTMSTVNQGDIESLIIFLPPLERQEKFTHIIREILPIIKRQEIVANGINLLYDQIMQKSFNVYKSH